MLDNQLISDKLAKLIGPPYLFATSKTKSKTSMDSFFFDRRDNKVTAYG